MVGLGVIVGGGVSVHRGGRVNCSGVSVIPGVGDPTFELGPGSRLEGKYPIAHNPTPIPAAISSKISTMMRHVHPRFPRFFGFAGSCTAGCLGADFADRGAVAGLGMGWIFSTGREEGLCAAGCAGTGAGRGAGAESGCWVGFGSGVCAAGGGPDGWGTAAGTGVSAAGGGPDGLGAAAETGVTGAAGPPSGTTSFPRKDTSSEACSISTVKGAAWSNSSVRGGCFGLTCGPDSSFDRAVRASAFCGLIARTLRRQSAFWFGSSSV